MTLEVGCEEMTGISHVATWAKSILDRGSRECKGTFWNSKEAGVTEQRLAEGSVELRSEWLWGPDWRRPIGHCKDWGFT